MVKFSVLIPVYYREQPDFLNQSLHSLFDQTCRATEVILVKDGPLPPGLDTIIEGYARRYPEMTVLALPENVGLGAALNEGLRLCSYELVARMDSDDICKPDRFEKQLAAYAQQPQLAVVGSWVDEFEVTPDQVLAQRRLPTERDEIYQYAKYRCPFNHPTVMFRKSAIEAVGSYLPFYLFEDYYLWARIIKAGYEIRNIPESLLYFRCDPRTIRRRGGLKYALSELRFLHLLRKMGFIKNGTFIKNATIRFTVRMLPNRIRALIYRKLLRDS